MTFHIRTATLADVPAMHRVRRAARENALGDSGRIIEASYYPYVEAGSIWVAVDRDEQITGFAAIDRGDASVWALFVHPDAEGCGVGKALHDTALGWAQQQGLRDLWLVTAAGTRAEQFYLRAGWTLSGAASPAEMRFERRLDDWVAIVTPAGLI